MNLSGKVLVITGSNGALGQAVAATLSRYGARLALLDHGQTPSAAPPAGALHYGGIDLTQADAAHSAMERVVKEAGRPRRGDQIARGLPLGKNPRGEPRRPGRP